MTKSAGFADLGRNGAGSWETRDEPSRSEERVLPSLRIEYLSAAGVLIKQEASLPGHDAIVQIRDCRLSGRAAGDGVISIETLTNERDGGSDASRIGARAVPTYRRSARGSPTRARSR